jgi:hypothetical protein
MSDTLHQYGNGLKGNRMTERGSEITRAWLATVSGCKSWLSHSRYMTMMPRVDTWLRKGCLGRVQPEIWRSFA